MKTSNTLFALILVFVLPVTMLSCGDKSTDKTEPVKTSPQVYNDLVFSATNAYFATNGKTAVPVDATMAKTMVADIDITYIFNSGYTKPGFFEPIARSDSFYWDNYREPWLADAIHTEIFSGDLEMADFNEARTDQSLIAKYFEEKNLELTPHAIFPEGTCIGGRSTSSPSSVGMGKGTVFAFKNTKTMKRGLILVDMDQHQAYPYWNTETKVDIIIEK